MASRFQRGTGCYSCETCTRKTRATGNQSMGSKLCTQCWDLAGLENEVSDGFYTTNEAQNRARLLIEEIEAKGGDASEWRSTFHLPK